jgi:uncharacterized protein YgbK (DUF1537 family)
MQYGNQSPMTNEQIQAMMQKMQLQQKTIQQAVQKTMKDMLNDLNKLYEQQDWSNMNFPIIMPVVIMPQQKNTQATTPTKTPAATTTTNK